MGLSNINFYKFTDSLLQQNFVITVGYMARRRKKPHQLLADSLSLAKAASKDSIVKSEALERADRERLVKAQCLTEIIRGWYLPTPPDGGAVQPQAHIQAVPLIR